MIVYAVNVHTGGGKVLLDELLTNNPFGQVSALFHDRRYNPPVNKPYSCFSIKPSVLSRLLAELSLYKHLKDHPDEFVLFFGNLPPFFRKIPNSALYLQNCFLLPKVKIETNSVKTFLRLFFERLVLNLSIRNVAEIWVQTDWMMSGLKNFKNLSAKKMPFLPKLPPAVETVKKYDLISVTSSAKHKRLDLFLESLKSLSQKVSQPVNVLIIMDSDSQVSDYEYSIPNNSFVRVTFTSRITRDELFQAYQESKVAVITSAYESYSLPVHEALHFKLKVICPNLPYVSEVLSQVTTYKNGSASDLAEKILTSLQN